MVKCSYFSRNNKKPSNQMTNTLFTYSYMAAACQHCSTYFLLHLFYVDRISTIRLEITIQLLQINTKKHLMNPNYFHTTF